ncbi:hypothetical protein PPBDW_p0006 (plasmid) [Photobacterium kishitanii]|nr:hypothetical protein PPBDW_p0006 [Photobacterium kishitanii]
MLQARVRGGLLVWRTELQYQYCRVFNFLYINHDIKFEYALLYLSAPCDVFFDNECTHFIDFINANWL